jgi:hypothetical protein
MAEKETTKKRFNLSLDTWAVALALVLVVLVKLGVVTKVPW